MSPITITNDITCRPRKCARKSTRRNAKASACPSELTSVYRIVILRFLSPFRAAMKSSRMAEFFTQPSVTFPDDITVTKLPVTAIITAESCLDQFEGRDDQPADPRELHGYLFLCRAAARVTVTDFSVVECPSVAVINAMATAVPYESLDTPEAVTRLVVHLTERHVFHSDEYRQFVSR